MRVCFVKWWLSSCLVRERRRSMSVCAVFRSLAMSVCAYHLIYMWCLWLYSGGAAFRGRRCRKYLCETSVWSRRRWLSPGEWCMWGKSRCVMLLLQTRKDFDSRALRSPVICSDELRRKGIAQPCLATVRERSSWKQNTWRGKDVRCEKIHQHVKTLKG